MGTMDLLITVKSTNVSLIVKTLGDKKTVQVTNSSIVTVHSGFLNVKENGLVTISTISLLIISTPMIPMVILTSIMVITTLMDILMISFIGVITMVITLLNLVKCINVSLIMKTPGELNIAQKWKMSTVIVHFD